MRIRINDRKCQGFGMCALAAPDLFGVGERDGYAYLKTSGNDSRSLDYLKVASISDGNMEAAKMAAENCPTQAIDILDDNDSSLLIP
jgi:ferredoxin